jgi:drug/metabolite transporter (DMT)-like permease
VGELRLGEIAALATALAWSGCAQFFAAGGMRIGSVAVNHVRLAFAIVIVPLLHLAVLGTLVPHAGARDATLLVFSALFGITLGDASGFRALVLIGASRTTLVQTLSPAVAALLAAAFLGERIGPWAWVGIVVTIAGLLVSVAGRLLQQRRRLHDDGPDARTLAVGLLFALGGAVGQASGQVLAKPALAHVDPLGATLIRVVSGALMLWLFTGVTCLVRRERPRWWGAWSDRRGLGLTLGGTMLGPACGVWLSQVATKHAPVGIAATLMALVPLFVLLQRSIAQRRHPEPHELLGAVVAVAGVAILVGSSLHAA